MKILFAAAALLAVGTVSAQELKYGDLNYFYKKGQLDAGVAVDMLHEGQRINNAKFYSLGYIGSAKATYGVMDSVNAFVQTEYAYELNTDNGDSKSRSFNSDGVRNISLGADYRLYNQNAHLFNLDVGAVVKAPIEDAVRGNYVGGIQDGNYADSSNTVEVHARAGRKWDLANEVFFLAGIVYNMDGELTQKESGAADTQIDYDSSIDYKLSANYQWRPVNTFMTGFGIGATYFGEKKASTSPSNPKFNGTQESHLDFNFTFAAKYLVTDHMIVSLNMMNSVLADYDVSAQIESTKRTSYGYSFGVNYLFE